MRRLPYIVVAAAAITAACAGKRIEEASVGERRSHNGMYAVLAEPVVVDARTGWVNVKVQIKSDIGTDSVAFNLIVK